jgi:MoaA/NifB/PqqE/SkfB family radical SAM enzyme
MSYTDTIRKTWSGNILFSALVELTYRCNLDCSFCYNDIDSQGVPMGKEGYFRFFEDLRDMEVLNLVLTGGEPLAHPDFLALGRRARELGFVVRLKSNGHALRRTLAERVKKEIDPYVVEVSLHGASAETHDRQTRVPGSFDRLISNVREMTELGIRTKFNCILTRWNEHEIEGMLELAEALGVLIRIDPQVTPRDNGDTSVLSLSASKQGIRRLFRLQQARAKAAGEKGAVEIGRQADEDMPAPTQKHCGAGSSGIAVDPFGNVYPCVQWRRPVGNLHEKSIKDIWTGSPDLVEIRDLTVKVKEVAESYRLERPLFSFCPGVAVVNSGDPLRLDSATKMRSRILSEVKKEKKS